MAKYEVVTVENVEFSIDVSIFSKTEDFWINATNIGKAKNRTPYEWLRLPSTEKYIEALVKKHSYLDPKVGKIPILKTVKGRYGGTYLHRKLALPFLQWICPEFAVECNDYLEDMLSQEHLRKCARLEAKTGYRPMTDAIQEAHDPCKFYHYSNEADMILVIIMGKSAKQLRNEFNTDNIRDCMCAQESLALVNLQRANTSLIQLGFDYEKRKEMLERLYKEKFSYEAINNEEVKEIEGE